MNQRTWLTTALSFALAATVLLNSSAMALDLWPFNKKDKEESSDVTSAEAIKNETLGVEEQEKEKRAKKAEKEAKRQQKKAAKAKTNGKPGSSTTEQQPAATNDPNASASSQQPATTSNSSASAATAPPPQEQPVQPKVFIQSPISDQINSLKVDDPIKQPDYHPEKDYLTIDDPNNPLGITISAQKLDRSADLIDKQHYAEALKALQPLKEWLVDATEVHINLHKTLKDIPSAQVQAELEKQLALQFAVLRDKAFFQLGMVALGQKDYNLAIKNLSRVVQSQPRSPMGAKAYEVLQSVGFTERVQLKDEKH